jgi:cell wall-associated NlpC family hydrolase
MFHWEDKTNKRGVTMKKILIGSATGLMVLASSFFTSPSFETKALAAEYVGQNETEEQIANAIINTGVGLIGKATYAPTAAEVSRVEPYKFRCASFVNFVFGQNGIDLATSTEDDMMQLGEYVPRDQLKKGDLVFFDSNPGDSIPTDHVGIYYGNNKLLHMANTKLNIAITDMHITSYYTDNYVTAKRVIPGYMVSNPMTQAEKIVNLAYDLKEEAKITSTTNNDSTLTFTNPGWVEYLYRTNGIQLGSKSLTELMSKGTYVAKKDLKKGDLIFFNNTVGSSKPTLVGIYAGNQKIITSSSALGVVQRTFFMNYYNDHYITARRVLSEPTPTVVTHVPTSTYTVKSGDTLYLISQRLGTTVAELKKNNGLTTDMIYVGQTLKVAASDATVTTYQVKSGDTLYLIAKANNTTVAKIKEVNHLTTDMIYVGQYLKLSAN